MKTGKLKHVAATRIWCFIHSKDELSYEEHNHLKHCEHCDAVFKYFAVWQENASGTGELEEFKQCA